VINKVVLSSNTSEKNPKISFISKFTKNKKVISNNDKRIDNVDLKKNMSQGRDQLNKNQDRRDNKIDLSHSNRKDKKDIFLSQLDGSLRKNRNSSTNWKDHNSYNNNNNDNKTRISNTIGKSRSLPPLIKEKKNHKIPNTSYRTKSDSNNTFLTDVASSSTLKSKSEDLIYEKNGRKRIPKAENLNKRLLSRSTLNLNHLERVDSMDAKKGTGIQIIGKERRVYICIYIYSYIYILTYRCDYIRIDIYTYICVKLCIYVCM
jgi:hypothetical protein